MEISKHADHTEELYNLRAEDIHKWIDGYFDRQSFENFLEHGRTPGYDPYKHRKFRHCREALPEVLKEFSDKYSPQDIRNVFECHIRDDYNDYIPSRDDFTNGTFSEKYHESDEKQEDILTHAELSKYFKGLYYQRKGKKKPLLNRFGTRIILPAAAALMLFVVSVFFIILPLFHDSLMAEKEEMIEEISSVAVSILDYYRSLETGGRMTGEEARTAAVDEIVKLRYGLNNDNYFWITDMQPVMIMHPWRPDLSGRNLTDYRDNMNRSGKKLFVESVELVKQAGGGFLEYLWQLDEDSSRVVPKLSYVRGFEAWNWIIGTGIYVQDVEEEISRLTKRLIFVLLIISAIMVIIVFYIAMQSLKIERNRMQAEAGLVEAKERYRALVEASNEGYLLSVNKQTVFSNPTFQRMTGYSEDDIIEDDFFKTLFPDTRRNKTLQKSFINLYSDNPNADEFEAVIKCRSNAYLDVVVRVSRIFLSEENGLVISFKPFINRTSSAPLFIDSGTADTPARLLSQLQQTETALQTVRLVNQLPLSVRTMVFENADSSDIRKLICRVYAGAVERLVSFAFDEMGEPPCSSAFLSLGSSGREEMTLFSDQDNALVFDSEASGETLERIRLYFLNLADKVCTLLKQAGFPYCPGGIMAVNPAYCLSMNEWKRQYSSWFLLAEGEALLDIHVFFDISSGWGDAGLVDGLKSFIIRECAERPEFLVHFSRDCLRYRVPRGFLGNVKTESRNGMQVVNIKETLIPLINFARIYALREGIEQPSTLKRLEALTDRSIISQETHREMRDAFETLWRLRFSNQVLSHGELRKVNDDLDPSCLSEGNMRDLREAVAVIAAAQSRLSYDFLGVDLS